MGRYGRDLIVAVALPAVTAQLDIGIHIDRLAFFYFIVEKLIGMGIGRRHPCHLWCLFYCRLQDVMKIW